MQRGGNCAEAVDKASGKVGKPQKLLHQLTAGGRRPIRDCTDLVWVHPNVVLGDNESVEGNGGGVELSFHLTFPLAKPQERSRHLLCRSESSCSPVQTEVTCSLW